MNLFQSANEFARTVGVTPAAIRWGLESGAIEPQGRLQLPDGRMQPLFDPNHATAVKRMLSDRIRQRAAASIAQLEALCTEAPEIH